MLSNRPTSARRVLFLCALCGFSVRTAGCGELPLSNRLDLTLLGPPVAEVVISGPGLPAVPGETMQLKAAIVFAGGAARRRHL